MSVCGWVAKRREHGEHLAFVDLRDHTGIVQCVVPGTVDVRSEYVVAVEGIVRRCLRKRADERYPDASALRHDLEHWRELDPAQFASTDEAALAPTEEHLLLFVAGVCVAFLASSTLLVTAAYLVAHR